MRARTALMNAVAATLFGLGLILAGADTPDPAASLTVMQVATNLFGLGMFGLSLYLLKKG